MYMKPASVNRVPELIRNVRYQKIHDQSENGGYSIAPEKEVRDQIADGTTQGTGRSEKNTCEDCQKVLRAYFGKAVCKLHQTHNSYTDACKNNCDK